jgi:hypothetical protein
MLRLSTGCYVKRGHLHYVNVIAIHKIASVEDGRLKIDLLSQAVVWFQLIVMIFSWDNLNSHVISCELLHDFRSTFAIMTSS